MNPLQTNPHLFANTKFKALVDERDVYPILGVIANTSLYLEDAMLGDTYCIRIKRCQLIARPIEDMTRKEAKGATELLNEPYKSDSLAKLSEFISSEQWLPSNIMLYLLEVGVYPFPQSHFGDTVIDTRTLTNEV